MARAMVAGLIKNGATQNEQISCTSGSGVSAKNLANDFGIQIADSRKALITDSDIIILAFKPQHLDTITQEEGKAADNKFVVSVLAGRNIESYRKAFPNARNIARVMPNTPSKIGKGVSAYCFEQAPSPEDRATLDTLLASLGASYEVNESQMHIATAISGCGPAVFFRFVDLISNAGAAHGLSKELALALATETGIGALELLKGAEVSPQTLVDEVTSPNGVTHALLKGLESRELNKVVSESITDAVNRSIELS